MIIPFHQLPDHSRIWIFQSSRKLTAAEADFLIEKVDFFLQGWTAHKADLHAASLLQDDIFLVVAVDESMANASGCSIDKLYQFIREIQTSLHVDLLNRLVVAYHMTPASPLSFASLDEMERRIQAGEIGGDCLVCDLTVSTKGDFTSRFFAPLKETWLSRYQHA